MPDRFTHWSPADNPHRALCGKWIFLQDFSPAPSCPECIAAIEEDDRQLKKLRDERTTNDAA